MTPAPLTHFTKDHAVSMTLRDYFAAKALQGLLANGEYWNHIGGTDSAECAALAYICADAMMKAREA